LDTLSLRQVIISPISAKKMAQRFTRLRKLTLSAQVQSFLSELQVLQELGVLNSKLVVGLSTGDERDGLLAALDRVSPLTRGLHRRQELPLER
jgi:hypothetical protein